MRPFRKTWLLAFAALLCSLVVPQAQAAWQCEGRTCGTNPWFCCCDSPAGARDANCDEPVSAHEPDGTCATDCGCVMTVRAVNDASTASPLRDSTGQLPVTAAAPRTRLELLPLPSVACFPPETRGPPIRHCVCGPTSLRAPPAA